MRRTHHPLINRQRRHRRVRARIHGTPTRPRLSVFRSGQHLVVQIIDDTVGRTLAAAVDRDVIGTHHDQSSSDGSPPKAGATQEHAEGRKVACARAVGRLIAERARMQGVTKVTFDRGGYTYHGRVGAVAEGAREGGLEL